MADSKITQLTELTSVDDTDLLAIVDDPSGTPITKKITRANLLNSKVIYKSADETVNNSNVLQNDDHLTFPIGANEVWALQIFILFQSGTTPDFKYSWSIPSGATGSVNSQGGYFPHSMSQTVTFSTAGLGTDDVLDSGGVITNGSNAGSVTFQWAQNTQNPSDTKVLKGSYIIATRLA